MNRLRDQVIALAGVFQAARLAQQLARDGRADADAFRASLESLMRLDAPTTESIFGGARGVALGLTVLRDKLAGNSEPRDLEMARYVISMMQLETRLRRDTAVQQTVHRGIETVQSQMVFFEATQDEGAREQQRVDKLAELYTQTLSTLPPRIIVSGDHGHLANPAVAGRVRGALFAGVRAAFLWRQLGGSRWQLLVGRKKIAAEAAQILDDLPRS
jgi:high frequency lysogenization protein